MENKEMHAEEKDKEIIKEENVEEVKENTETTKNNNNEEAKKEEKTETPRMYTQEEYENGIKKAIANRFKNIENKKEEVVNTQNNEGYNNILNENKQLKMQIKMADLGVNKEYIDYIAYKLKDSEDFENDLSKFIENNPHYTNKIEKPKNTGKLGEKAGAIEEDGVTAILRAKHPDIFN